MPVTETPVQVGIAGCSSMGRSHVGALAAVDGADLVDCADHTAETTHPFGETYGYPLYTDHATLLTDADLDAVYACTPNGAHRDIVIGATTDGIDALYEESLEITPDRVGNIAATCRDAGVALACIL